MQMEHNGFATEVTIREEKNVIYINRTIQIITCYDLENSSCSILTLQKLIFYRQVNNITSSGIEYEFQSSTQWNLTVRLMYTIYKLFNGKLRKI